MYLTREQVQALNEKYGYFEFADAQGDVSRDFAQAAIEKHEAIRAAAPALLAALDRLVDLADGFSVSGVYFNEATENRAAIRVACEVIARATGSTQ